MTNFLQHKAMLAQLSISQWTASKQDKRATAEVETNHGAHDAGKFNKKLVDKALLEPISKLASEARETHYHYTLSWSDSGPRILPAELFSEYTQKYRAIKTRFEAAVNTVVAQYPAEVQAARVRLGTLYEPGDYPDPSDMAARFALNLEFTPVPDGDDFRVSVSASDREELSRSVRESIASRLADTVSATRARVKDVVSKIEERLSKEDAIFKDSLITNAIELCHVLDGLNITEDSVITDVCQDIRDHLLMPPSVLRTRPDVRKTTAAHAKRILEKL